MATIEKHRYNLTAAFVERAPFEATRQRLYFDTKVTGFGLKVGCRTKTFFAQAAVNGASRRFKIGRWSGVVGETVEQYRKKAKAVLVKMGDGVDPQAERRKAKARGITLEEAFELYKAGKEDPDARGVSDYDYHLHRYLSDWLKRPLAEITRAEVNARHKRIAQQIAKGEFPDSRTKSKRARPNKERTGETTADHVFHAFRATYNRAMRQHPELPANPIINVDWFRPKTTRRAIPMDGLRAWYAGTAQAKSTIRRDFMRFALFTGLRRESASDIKWKDVDLEGRTLFIPKPKGGEEKAFTLPLTDYLVDMLRARKAENETMRAKDMLPEHSEPFVFPAYSESGHIVEVRERFEGDTYKSAIKIKGKEVEVERSYTAHDLRRTFITLAESLDVSPYAIKALVNHTGKPRGDVTGGYMTIEVERLRAPMQQITERLLAIVQGPGPAEVLPMRKRAAR